MSKPLTHQELKDWANKTWGAIVNREDIIRMAREAGFDPHDMSADFTCNLKDMERFAALVAADEREACAKVCEQESNNFGGVAEGPFVTDFGKHTHMSMAAGAQNCATAIRARETT